MNIIVLVVDRLHAGFLGCYGNSWVATPHFNRLAAEGFLFDQAFVDHPDLAELCRSWWTGTHYLEREGPQTNLTTLVERFGQSGFATMCLTDESAVASHPLAAHFDEVVRVGQAAADRSAAETGEGRRMAESVEETEAAQFFAAATQMLEQPRQPFFLWLHSRGMDAPWDAPYEFRRQYADEEEADPPTIVTPPCRYLGEADDPDEVWGICQAYAGQVSLVDECLGGLLEMLDAEELASDTGLVVLGARGFPLGRNARLGGVDQALYGELAQTPWVIRLPDGTGSMARSQVLVQPCDLMPTLLDLSGLADVGAAKRASRSLLPAIRGDLAWYRDRICLASEGGERAFRTPAWYLRLPAPRSTVDESPAPELYTKPDDRWEVNDVAPRCPEIVAAMRAAHDELASSLSLDQGGNLPPLDDLLANDLR
ncbi:MAG TPA: sulfatase-like hydrolase/transferase [Pirellulales bacterium]|nr:sulfatase-like hydrolase/transferase [Pirellulales bacterium]